MMMPHCCSSLVAGAAFSTLIFDLEEEDISHVCYLLDLPIDKYFVWYCDAHECDLVYCASLDIFIQATKCSNRS